MQSREEIRPELAGVPILPLFFIPPQIHFTESNVPDLALAKVRQTGCVDQMSHLLVLSLLILLLQPSDVDAFSLSFNPPLFAGFAKASDPMAPHTVDSADTVKSLKNFVTKSGGNIGKSVEMAFVKVCEQQRTASPKANHSHPHLRTHTNTHTNKHIFTRAEQPPRPRLHLSYKSGLNNLLHPILHSSRPRRPLLSPP